MKKIGVLALQGDFEAHEKMLRHVGCEATQIRKAAQLDSIDGLIIPGGESTTLIKLMKAFQFVEAIGKFHRDGKGIFGTCAGSILVARHIANSDQFRFGFIDITVERNGYGRQVNSFEQDVNVKILGPEPMHAIFIRAPRITACGANVTALATLKGSVIAARQGQILVSTFHPEISDDARLHAYFVQSVVA